MISDMAEYLISIIIPFFNCEWKLLKICLESIDIQLESDIEVIIIDDGSNIIKTYDECKQFLKGKNNYRVFRNRNNKGVSFARNYGIENSNGRYILFVDADDFVEPKIISRLKSIIEKYNVDTVFFEYSKYDGKNKKKVFRNIRPSDCMTFGQKMAERMIAGSEFNSPCTILYKRSIIINNKVFFDEGLKLGEDFKFNYQYFKEYKYGFYIQESLYNYRYQLGSATNSFSIKKISDSGEGFYIRNDLLKTFFSGDEEKFEAHIKNYYHVVLSHVVNAILEKQSKYIIMNCLELPWVRDLLVSEVRGWKYRILKLIYVKKIYFPLVILAKVKQIKDFFL
jgi:glycosyltransferase involved in cell wall biosynthesis